MNELQMSEIHSVANLVVVTAITCALIITDQDRLASVVKCFVFLRFFVFSEFAGM